MLNKTLDCDRFEAVFLGAVYVGNADRQQYGNLILRIDDATVSVSGGGTGASGNGQIKYVLENCRGKNIKFEAWNGTANYASMYTLKEYTKKV